MSALPQRTDTEQTHERTTTRRCVQCGVFSKTPAGFVALVLVLLVYLLEILDFTPAIVSIPWFQGQLYFSSPDKILYTAEIFASLLLLCCLGIHVKCFRGNSDQKKDTLQRTPSVSASPIQEPYRVETAEAETPMIVSTRVVPRSIAMDLLKVIMIFFVVLAHTFEGTIVAAPGFMVGMTTEGVLGFDALKIIGLPLFMAAMPVFFFISGLYTMNSFKRKGCAQFLIQKLLRLLLPTIVVTCLISPLMVYLCFRMMDLAELDGVSVWQFIVKTAGPNHTWFCLHLLLANVGFAAVWYIKPGTGDVRIRQWLERNLRFDWTLYLWALGLAVVVTLEFLYVPVGGIFLCRPGLGPWDTFSARIAYVFLGIYAGYAKWHDQIHAFARASKSEVMESQELLKTRNMMKLSAGMMVTTMFATFGMFGIRIIVLKDSFEDILGPSSSLMITALQCIFAVLATLAIVLLMVYASYRWLNIRPNACTNFLVRSMYTVFILHIVMLPCVQWLWITLLRGVFDMTLEINVSLGVFVGLSEGTLVASFFFIFIVTNLILWPFSYLVCQLPLVNRIL